MKPPRIKKLGIQPYIPVMESMRAFTSDRTADTRDEIWVLQHEPVYTLGQAGDPSNILNASNIPVEQSDRGGQVTYHGPGQLIVYPLLDLRRYSLGVRALVELLENVVIDLLAQYDIPATARREAPGVYVDGAKIAALGLRIRKSCSFHGLSLNVDMDLKPFDGINPCGYEALPVTQLADHVTVEGIDATADQVVDRLLAALSARVKMRELGE